MVLTEDLADDLYHSDRSTITIDILPSALVVEVVSPGKANYDYPSGTLRNRDYGYKKSEYAARGTLRL